MQQGFFSNKDLQSRNVKGGKILSCMACGLYKNKQTPKMKPFGEFKKLIMNIGEFPSFSDDREGRPFSDRFGRFLAGEYEKIGIDLEKDCISLNAVNCAKNKPPTQHEIDCCRRIVFRAIEKHKPKVIVLFGQAAVISVIGDQYKHAIGRIDKWTGWLIPDQDLKCWIIPMFSPKFVMTEMKDRPEVKTVWDKDFQLIEKAVKTPWPRYKKPKIDFIEDLSILNNIESDLVAIDYETTGLKPQGKGHRIVCAAVADTPDHAYAFLMPLTPLERKPFIDLLKNPGIHKIAQNMKFEDNWTNVRLRTKINGWLWDTMLATHIYDNRSGITSLAFQSYVQFGISDYDSEIHPYLVAKDDKDGNAFNNVLTLVKSETGREKLLEYCALDTIFEYRLALKQMGAIDYDYLPF